MKVVIDALAHGDKLAARFSPHKLSGNWSGFWECHVESDWLLVWMDEDEETIVLVRLGSHSDLFG